MEKQDLQILLEYAYRGVAAQGGKWSCHNDRFKGCALCDALTAAETEVFDNPPDIKTIWWWKRPRFWVYQPERYWRGWRSLLPVYLGSDEFDRWCLVLGWSITGHLVVALWE